MLLLTPRESVRQRVSRGLLAFFGQGALRFGSRWQRLALQLQVVDPVTGLLNRRRSREVFASLLASSRERHCLLLCDLDQFGFANAVLGHDSADRLLRQFADILRREAGPREAARIRNDQFIAMVPARKAGAVAQRLRAECEKQLAPQALAIRRGAAAAKVIDPHQGPLLTVSIGVVEAQPGVSLDALTTRAWALVHEAKLDGGNKVLCEVGAPAPAHS